MTTRWLCRQGGKADESGWWHVCLPYPKAAQVAQRRKDFARAIPRKGRPRHRKHWHRRPRRH